jgi:hypothetical protein
MLQAEISRVRIQMRWIFKLTEIFQPHYGPGVQSVSNRNEYQESSFDMNGGRRVKLTNSPPSVSRFSRENVGASTSHKPMGLHDLLQIYLYLFSFSPRTVIIFRADTSALIFYSTSVVINVTYIKVCCKLLCEIA